MPDPNKLKVGATIYMVPLGWIRPRTVQPRTEFKENVKSISKSIAERRARGLGIAGSGINHALEGSWEAGAFLPDGSIKRGAKINLTTGETRYWSAKEAGFTDADEVPLTFEDVNDEEAYENALVENVVRFPLNPIDYANALQHWMQNRKKPLSLQQAAERLGKTKGEIEFSLTPVKVDKDLLPFIGEDGENMSVLRKVNRTDGALRKRCIAMLKGGRPPTAIEAVIRSHTVNPTPAKQQMTPMNIAKALDAAINQVRQASSELQAVEKITTPYRRSILDKCKTLQTNTQELYETAHARRAQN